MQKRFRCYTFVGKQQLHSPALPQRQVHCAELLAPVVGSRTGAVHELAGDIVGIRVEGILARLALGKFLRPFCAVVDRRRQRHHRLGRKLQPARLLLKESSGLLVEPALQRLVIAVASHLAGKRRSIIALRQRIERFLYVIHAVVQPHRACQHARHRAICAVICVPKRLGLRAHVLKTILPEKAYYLRPGIAVRTLGQHGKRHVDIQRRIDEVAAVSAFQHRAGRSPDEALHILPVYIDIPPGALVCPPCVIDLRKAFVVKRAILFHIRGFIRILCHFGIRRFGKRFIRRAGLGLVCRRAALYPRRAPCHSRSK